VSDQLIDLNPSTTPRATNAFSLANLPTGVYTLDLITQKGNTRAAYEGILVISQQPTIVINETTRNVINQEINQNIEVDIDEGCPVK
jgi:3-dehydroquinate synthase class II